MITARCAGSQVHGYGDFAHIAHAGSIHDPETRGSAAAFVETRFRLPYAVNGSNHGADQDGSPAAFQELEDDRSVPEKHISRWNNEGGSLGPAD